MGILDKVMFWKKKDEFADVGLGDKENLAFGDEFGQQPGANPQGMGAATGLGPEHGMGQDYGQQPIQQGQPSIPSFSPPQQYQQPPTYSPQQELETKSLEVISSKLDAIRASIDSLNQRLANLEAIAKGEEDKGREKRYY